VGGSNVVDLALASLGESATGWVGAGGNRVEDLGLWGKKEGRKEGEKKGRGEEEVSTKKKKAKAQVFHVIHS